MWTRPTVWPGTGHPLYPASVVGSWRAAARLQGQGPLAGVPKHPGHAHRIGFPGLRVTGFPGSLVERLSNR